MDNVALIIGKISLYFDGREFDIYVVCVGVQEMEMETLHLEIHYFD